MKIYVTRIKSNFDTGEEVEFMDSFYEKDVACLYRNKGRVTIHFNGGHYVVVKHTLTEIENIIKYPQVYERSY